MSNHRPRGPPPYRNPMPDGFREFLFNEWGRPVTLQEAEHEFQRRLMQHSHLQFQRAPPPSYFSLPNQQQMHLQQQQMLQRNPGPQMPPPNRMMPSMQPPQFHPQQMPLHQMGPPPQYQRQMGPPPGQYRQMQQQQQAPMPQFMSPQGPPRMMQCQGGPPVDPRLLRNLQHFPQQQPGPSAPTQQNLQRLPQQQPGPSAPIQQYPPPRLQQSPPSNEDLDLFHKFMQGKLQRELAPQDILPLYVDFMRPQTENHQNVAPTHPQIVEIWEGFVKRVKDWREIRVKLEDGESPKIRIPSEYYDVLNGMKKWEKIEMLRHLMRVIRDCKYDLKPESEMGFDLKDATDEQFFVSFQLLARSALEQLKVIPWGQADIEFRMDEEEKARQKGQDSVQRPTQQVETVQEVPEMPTEESEMDFAQRVMRTVQANRSRLSSEQSQGDERAQAEREAQLQQAQAEEQSRQTQAEREAQSAQAQAQEQARRQREATERLREAQAEEQARRAQAERNARAHEQARNSLQQFQQAQAQKHAARSVQRQPPSKHMFPLAQQRFQQAQANMNSQGQQPQMSQNPTPVVRQQADAQSQQSRMTDQLVEYVKRSVQMDARLPDIVQNQQSHPSQMAQPLIPPPQQAPQQSHQPREAPPPLVMQAQVFPIQPRQTQSAPRPAAPLAQNQHPQLVRILQQQMQLSSQAGIQYQQTAQAQPSTQKAPVIQTASSQGHSQMMTTQAQAQGSLLSALLEQEPDQAQVAREQARKAKEAEEAQEQARRAQEAQEAQEQARRAQEAQEQKRRALVQAKIAQEAEQQARKVQEAQEQARRAQEARRVDEAQEQARQAQEAEQQARSAQEARRVYEAQKQARKAQEAQEKVRRDQEEEKRRKAQAEENIRKAMVEQKKAEVEARVKAEKQARKAQEAQEQARRAQEAQEKVRKEQEEEKRKKAIAEQQKAEAEARAQAEAKAKAQAVEQVLRAQVAQAQGQQHMMQMLQMSPAFQMQFAYQLQQQQQMVGAQNVRLAPLAPTQQGVRLQQAFQAQQIAQSEQIKRTNKTPNPAPQVAEMAPRESHQVTTPSTSVQSNRQQKYAELTPMWDREYNDAISKLQIFGKNDNQKRNIINHLNQCRAYSEKHLENQTAVSKRLEKATFDITKAAVEEIQRNIKDPYQMKCLKEKDPIVQEMRIRNAFKTAKVPYNQEKAKNLLNKALGESQDLHEDFSGIPRRIFNVITSLAGKDFMKVFDVYLKNALNELPKNAPNSTEALKRMDAMSNSLSTSSTSKAAPAISLTVEIPTLSSTQMETPSSSGSSQLEDIMRSLGAPMSSNSNRPSTSSSVTPTGEQERYKRQKEQTLLKESNQSLAEYLKSMMYQPCQSTTPPIVEQPIEEVFPSPFEGIRMGIRRSSPQVAATVSTVPAEPTPVVVENSTETVMPAQSVEPTPAEPMVDGQADEAIQSDEQEEPTEPAMPIQSDEPLNQEESTMPILTAEPLESMEPAPAELLEAVEQLDESIQSEKSMEIDEPVEPTEDQLNEPTMPSPPDLSNQSDEDQLEVVMPLEDVDQTDEPIQSSDQEEPTEPAMPIQSDEPVNQEEEAVMSTEAVDQFDESIRFEQQMEIDEPTMPTSPDEPMVSAEPTVPTEPQKQTNQPANRKRKSKRSSISQNAPSTDMAERELMEGLDDYTASPLKKTRDDDYETPELPTSENPVIEEANTRAESQLCDQIDEIVDNIVEDEHLEYDVEEEATSDESNIPSPDQAAASEPAPEEGTRVPHLRCGIMGYCKVTVSPVSPFPEPEPIPSTIQNSSVRTSDQENTNTSAPTFSTPTRVNPHQAITNLFSTRTLQGRSTVPAPTVTQEKDPQVVAKEADVAGESYAWQLHAAIADFPHLQNELETIYQAALLVVSDENLNPQTKVSEFFDRIADVLDAKKNSLLQ